MDDTLDFFAVLDKREAAIAQADESVRKSAAGDLVVGKVIDMLVRQYETFTGDDIAAMLDEMGVLKDLATRRRLVSTIVNRGRERLWVVDGWQTSHDPRRNARPIMRWRVTHERTPQPARLGRANI